MKQLVVTLALGFLLPLAAKAECDVHQVDAAAVRLQNSTRELASVIREIIGDSHIARTAEELSHASHELHELAHNHATCRAIDGAFHEVEEHYEHLNEDLNVNNDDTRHLNRDRYFRETLANVRREYQAVDAAVHGTTPPPPPPRLVTTQVTISSSRFRPTSQTFPGAVQSAVVVGRPHSFAPCILGSSFSWQGNVVTVTNGCRATFNVTYLAR